MTQDTMPADISVAIRSPQFFEFSGDYVAADAGGALSPGWQLTDGLHSWFYRAQNFVVGVAWLNEGQVLEESDVPDEHVLLILDGTAVEVRSGGSEGIPVEGPSLVVVPPGKSRVVGTRSGFVTRVFSSYATEVVSKAFNNSTYNVPDPTVVGLPSLTSDSASAGVEVYPMSEVPDDPERMGRIFRTESLMVNWFEPQTGPRDTNRLTPHSHDDFEQASVTLAGDYVHHIRRPWTARLEDWRPDEHVQVSSPSVTIIPPGNIHTTRAIGDGVHFLIDVFAPPRQDFIERGWVLNQSRYERAGDSR